MYFSSECYSTPSRDYEAMSLEDLLEKTLSNSHVSFQGDNTEKRCRAELARRAGDPKESWKTLGVAFQAIMDAVSDYDSVVRARAYLTLNAILEAGPKNIRKVPEIPARKLALCIAQAVEAEREDDRRDGHGPGSSFASRIPSMGAESFDRMFKKWPKLFDTSFMIALVAMGKKSMCGELAKHPGAARKILCDKETQDNYLPQSVRGLRVFVP